jgi:hypothetical protein
MHGMEKCPTNISKMSNWHFEDFLKEEGKGFSTIYFLSSTVFGLLSFKQVE